MFYAENKRTHDLLNEMGIKHPYYEPHGNHDTEFAGKVEPLIFAWLAEQLGDRI
ncbi:hypothetical protein ACFL4D_00850 [Candidatus Margulisiibacteriota bacterium]